MASPWSRRWSSDHFCRAGDLRGSYAIERAIDDAVIWLRGDAVPTRAFAGSATAALGEDADSGSMTQSCA